MSSHAFDRYFDDALQESILSIIEHLARSDVGNPAHWQSALGFVPMNARLGVAFHSQSPTGTVYSRRQRNIARKIVLNPELLSAPDYEIQDIFNKDKWEDIQAVRASMLPLPISDAPDILSDPSEVSNAKLDATRLRKWVLDNRPSRELEIFDLRLLTDDPASYDECGLQLGLTGERVRQIEKELLRTLKVAYLNDLRP